MLREDGGNDEMLCESGGEEVRYRFEFVPIWLEPL